MTNEEAIELLNQEKIPMILDGKPNEHLAVAHIKAIEALEESAKLKAEINRLIGKCEMYRDMADSFCESNKKLKAEIEQLLELLKSSCDFCHYKLHHGNEEPCRSCKTYGNWKLKGRVEE